MAKEKMQHCFNCGEELGVYCKNYCDIDTCGKPECNREARHAEQEIAEREAEADGYSRYR